MNKPLFIFEMANNHQGSTEHGKRIIREIREVCNEFDCFQYAFKFQYRNLETFIHPDYQERMDIKNVKRFQDTKLSRKQFEELLSEVKENGFLAVCTPFDEISADRIAEQNYDYLKIASCSFTDWPLLEKIAEKNMPVIASGAGSSIEDVRNVVAFFENRGIDLTLMHCVAEYPTDNDKLQLNQIDLYKKEFPKLRIGFSTHENPDNLLPIKIAVAKGAEVFEKHVGVPTDSIVLNGYSACPAQVRAWLQAASEAFEACGDAGVRYRAGQKELNDLAALKRGVFIKNETVTAGKIDFNDIFLAFPCQPGQVVASDLSKYNEIFLNDGVKLKKNEPLMQKDVRIINISGDVMRIMKKLVQLLEKSNVVIPVGSNCEISHHYGVGQFEKTGVTMIDCVNREYCKKILVALPGQSHPSHYHKKKEETFVILHGDLTILLDGKSHILHKGDVMVIERNKKHSFFTEEGCVFEEISTTHHKNDSYYDEQENFVTPRKTNIHFTKEMLKAINEDK